jgi:cytidyltransferase-like protein
MDAKKKVFVSGCFDMLHSGHVAFLQEAATYGDLYVSVGSDSTIKELKGRYPVCSQEERVYMIKALACVHSVFIGEGSGMLDFLPNLDKVKPDIFITNEDGNTAEKKAAIEKRGIQYIVLKRVPHEDLPKRSTTELRSKCNIPYRIDLAGGWLDQPFVSKFYPGAVITISIEPTVEFNLRSGMATSSRNRAIELWNSELPKGDPEKIAKILFSFENTPGTYPIAGSQDALGIVLPGLNKLNYKGEYWPYSIQSVHHNDILDFIENHLYLIELTPREESFNVLENTKIDEQGAKRLADATENCWNSIMEKDAVKFGQYFRESFEAQIAMFPNMVTPAILEQIDHYKKDTLGWKLSGAGGGGYLIFVSDKEIPNSIRIKIRRKQLIF